MAVGFPNSNCVCSVCLLPAIELQRLHFTGHMTRPPRWQLFCGHFAAGPIHASSSSSAPSSPFDVETDPNEAFTSIIICVVGSKNEGRLGRSRSFAFLCRRSPISIRSLILPLPPFSDEMRESKTSFVLGAEMPNGLQLLTYFKELSALHWSKMHFQQCYQAVFVFFQVQDG